MSWGVDAIVDACTRLIAMGGCLCSKEAVTIDGTLYSIRDTIGEGGFSTISLAENTKTRKKFALKRITCHSTEDQIQANKEVEYHKKLDHPNILKLVGSAVIGRADISHNTTSEVLLLLPFYQRGTLHDELSRRQARKDSMSESLVLNLFQHICDAVYYLHTLQPEPLAHRDIKPHNILLDDDYTPILMDLGSMSPARVKVTNHSEAQHLQDTAAERCSMPYRAPELFSVNSRCNIDERTDVWSLGCLLYALCYFHSPYDAVYERGDSVALAVQSGSKNVRFPANSSYSQGIRDMVTSMLSVDYNERPFVNDITQKIKAIEEKNEEKL